MKKIIPHLIIFLSLLSANIHGKAPSFTHNLSRGRLGDNLIAYAQCKYLSWKHNASMFYHSFKYADQFMFTSQGKALTTNISRSFKYKKTINNENELNQRNLDTLYTLSYKVKIDGGIVKAVWGNPDLQSILTEAWQPRSPLKKLHLSNDMITIAVHIRKGSGGDRPLSSEQIYPSNFVAQACKQTKSKSMRQNYSDKSPHVLKFPPEQFYIDQLMLVSELLDNPPLYVYIFTDSKEPKKLAKRIEKHTNKKNITFDCRSDHNNNRASEIREILQDFYDMAQFDIIIRADSNLSKAAQLIGDHIVGIHPHKCHWEKNRLIIDESCALVRHTKKPYAQTYILPHDAHNLRIDLQHTPFS